MPSRSTSISPSPKSQMIRFMGWKGITRADGALGGRHGLPSDPFIPRSAIRSSTASFASLRPIPGAHVRRAVEEGSSGLGPAAFRCRSASRTILIAGILSPPARQSFTPAHSVAVSMILIIPSLHSSVIPRECTCCTGQLSNATTILILDLTHSSSRAASGPSPRTSRSGTFIGITRGRHPQSW